MLQAWAKATEFWRSAAAASSKMADVAAAELARWVCFLLLVDQPPNSPMFGIKCHQLDSCTKAHCSASVLEAGKDESL